MAEELSKTKVSPTANIIIMLGCISIGCLVGAFAYPLQRFEVWKQSEISQFNQEYSKVFILTDTDNGLPYGLDKTRAYKAASIYNEAKLQKLLLLTASILAGGLALTISDDIFPQLEINKEVKQINAQAKKQYLLDQIKHKWAMASQSQKLMFREELKELAALFGDESQEASEISETDKFINASYMLSEGHSIEYVVSQIWGIPKDSEEFQRVRLELENWLKDSE